MKHRILSDPLQEPRPAVGSLCPSTGLRAYFIQKRNGPGLKTPAASAGSKRSAECLVGCCFAELVPTPRFSLVSVGPVLTTKPYPQHLRLR